VGFDNNSASTALFFAVDAMTGDFAVVDEDGEDRLYHPTGFDKSTKSSKH
jgi:hypothetical protein